MSSYDDDQVLGIMSCAFSLNFNSFQSLRLEKLFPNFSRRLFDCLLITSCQPNSQDWGFSLQETLPYCFCGLLPLKRKLLCYPSE